MRRVALVCYTIVGLTFAEAALADAAKPPAPLSWSGIYVGGSVGGGWTKSDWTPTNNTTLWGDAPPWDSMSDRMDGLVGGVQVGFNYPLGRWLFGVEAQVFASGISNSFPYPGAFGAGDDQFDVKINALVLGSARVGYTFDRWLGYLKAGYAFAQVKTSVGDNVGPDTGSGKSNQWQTGPALGLGFEYALTPNMSVGLEYDYIWLNDATHQLGDASGSYTWKVGLDTQLALVKLNYRFPAFAEYARADAARPLAPFDWSGIYVGGSIGGGWTKSDWTPTNNTTTWGDAPPWDSMSDRMDGVVGGVQVGFNYPLGRWLFGVEAQVFASGISSSFPYSGAFGAGDDQFDAKINALVLGSARVGYTFDRWLGYLKAGYAFAQVKTSVSDKVGPDTGSGESTQWQAGPALGFGFEYALMPNLSVGLEYDYVWLNDATHELGDATGSYTWKVGLDTQLVMAKLNYRFPVSQ